MSDGFVPAPRATTGRVRKAVKYAADSDSDEKDSSGFDNRDSDSDFDDSDF